MNQILQIRIQKALKLVINLAKELEEIPGLDSLFLKVTEERLMVYLRENGLTETEKGLAREKFALALDSSPVLSLSKENSSLLFLSLEDDLPEEIVSMGREGIINAAGECLTCRIMLAKTLASRLNPVLESN
ncbi:MAG: hypothetical protein M1150_00095 [Patescibacteria group bacterium]|nr:hypothetical protein [Patescibacteria group bacterium]